MAAINQALLLLPIPGVPSGVYVTECALTIYPFGCGQSLVNQRIVILSTDLSTEY